MWAEQRNVRMGCSEQLITCRLWQPCSAALSLPGGQGFKLLVCFCSFLVMQCFSSLHVLACPVLLVGCRQVTLGVFCWGGLRWLPTALLWRAQHRLARGSLRLWAHCWELCSCTQLIHSPWAWRMGHRHGTACFIQWFKCCWPKEILWQILWFCCAVNQKAGRLFKYSSGLSVVQCPPVCEGKVSPWALTFCRGVRWQWKLVGGLGSCSLGMGFLVGIPELRDQLQKIAGPSKQTGAAYNCSSLRFFSFLYASF